jgi:hypothetical protein
MTDRSRALVRIEVPPAPTRQADARFRDFALVDHETRLTDRAQIERHLPDIMGRALARAWIDPAFRKALVDDPKATLAQCRLHLPATIGIEVQDAPGKRPMVIVSELVSPRPRRILYLQLVMVAGR